MTHRYENWVVTDIRPHTMLCPLPRKHWWEVTFYESTNTCHMTLRRRVQWWATDTGIGKPVVVRDVSEKTADEITALLIERSYEVWQDWFRKVGCRPPDELTDKAKRVTDALQQDRTEVKVKVRRA